MDALDDIAAARRRFEEACASLRPELHRFCTRMLGDPCDGEDVLQDALVLAFYRASELRDAAALKPWLFRIAHNKCIDVLRGTRRFEALDEDTMEDDDPIDERLDARSRAARAVTALARLPAKERACVVLKDLLECSLEETAAITASSVGAVKAAIHRGREKLAASEPPRGARLDPERRAIVERYLAAFNAQDWDGVRALVSADARLEVVHRAEGPFRESRYVANYESLPHRWRLALADVDGIESVVSFRFVEGAWRPHAIVDLAVDAGRIVRVRDYVHVDYLLRDSDVRELPLRRE